MSTAVTGRQRSTRRWGAGLTLGLACALPSTAEAQIGVLAGYNRDTIGKFLPESGFGLTDLADGYHVGVFLNFNLAAFAIRPALIYHRIPELVARAGEDDVKFDIDVPGIPARFPHPTPGAARSTLRNSPGPVLTFPSSTFSGVDDLLEARPVRAEFGLGLEVDVGFRLWPEVRYGFGLGSLMGSDVPHRVPRAQGRRRPPTRHADPPPRHQLLARRAGRPAPPKVVLVTPPPRT